MADPKDPIKLIEEAQAEMRAREQALEKERDDLARKNYYKTTLTWGVGLAGNVAGIVLAVKRKSGFWGGVGWFFLLGAAGTAVGYVVGSFLDGRPKQESEDGKDS